MLITDLIDIEYATVSGSTVTRSNYLAGDTFDVTTEYAVQLIADGEAVAAAGGAVAVPPSDSESVVIPQLIAQSDGSGTTSVLTNNGDGTYTHDDGLGVTTIIAVGSSSGGEFGVPLTASYSALSTDFSEGAYLVAFDTTSATLTLTIPDGLTDESEFEVSRVGVNDLIVATAGSETLGGDTTATLNQPGSARFVKSGTDWKLIFAKG